MNLTESFFVALEALKVNKIRSVLTMLGVVIGVTSVILLVSLGEGARAYVSQQFAQLGSNLLIVTPGRAETSGTIPLVGASVRDLTFEDAEMILRRGKGIRAVTPLIFGNGTIGFENRKRDTFVFGVTPSFQEAREFYPDVGGFISDDDVQAKRRVAVLGRRVKDELFGNNNPLGKFISVSGTKFRVIGLMQRRGVSLGYDIDDQVFIPVTAAEDLFNTKSLFQILVTAKSKEDIKRAMGVVTEILKWRHDNEVDFTVTDQTAMLASFDTILVALTFLVGAIAAISLLVGGVGIMNIMLVSVSERIKEIGLRKAVGAKRRDILIQFMIESTTLSALGGVVGIVFGTLLALYVGREIPKLPTVIPLWSILLAFGFSLLVGVFFGVYPARKASLSDPVEALRYE